MVTNTISTNFLFYYYMVTYYNHSFLIAKLLQSILFDAQLCRNLLKLDSVGGVSQTWPVSLSGVGEVLLFCAHLRTTKFHVSLWLAPLWREFSVQAALGFL